VIHRILKAVETSKTWRTSARALGLPDLSEAEKVMAGALLDQAIARAALLSQKLDCSSEWRIVARYIAFSIAEKAETFAEVLELLLPDVDERAPFKFASKAKAIIEKDFQRRLTLATIAREVGTSTTVLQREFVTAFNCSPHNYLTRTRIEHAVAYLTSTDIKVEAISSMVGYKYKKTFYQSLKKITSKTPAEVRRAA
jgi:YesN/AraC family two-component response regulator